MRELSDKSSHTKLHSHLELDNFASSVKLREDVFVKRSEMFIHVSLLILHKTKNPEFRLFEHNKHTV